LPKKNNYIKTAARGKKFSHGFQQKKKLHPCAGIEPISEESDLDTSACCLTSMAKG